MFPDPETFNPLRWVEPGYPTYQEPLTQFPTIINSTQFGYGRRTCQGQTVTDEDLLIGIGSIAWLFDIKPTPDKPSERVVTDSRMTEHKIGINEKATISHEELNAGVATEEPTMEAQILAKYSYPGTKPASKGQPAYKPLEWGDITKKPEDPTMDYSIFLIAKPIPFKFQLAPRDRQRALDVRKMFDQGVANGDYTQNREYWGPNQGRDKPLGWSKV
jgi:hypothetical protein